MAISPHLTIDVGGCFGLSPDGRAIAVAKKAVGRNMGKIVSLADGTVLTAFDRLPKGTSNIEFSPLGDQIVFGAMYCELLVADPVSGETIVKAKFCDDDAELQALAYTPDGKSLLRSTSGGTRVIDVSTGTVVDSLSMSTPDSTGPTQYGVFAFGKQGKKLALSANATVCIKDWPPTESETVVWSYALAQAPNWATFYTHKPAQLQFTPDGCMLLLADRSARLWIIDPSKGLAENSMLWLDRSTTRPERSSADPCFSGFDFSPDGRLLAFGVKGTLEIWSWPERTLVREILLPGKSPSAMQVEFNSTGDHIAVAMHGRTVIYYTSDLIG